MTEVDQIADLVIDKAKDMEDVERKQREAGLLRKKSISAHAIVKHQLIPGIKSPKTIKNMAKDGRLGLNEFYKDNKGTFLVLTSAVKRIRGYE